MEAFSFTILESVQIFRIRGAVSARYRLQYPDIELRVEFCLSDWDLSPCGPVTCPHMDLYSPASTTVQLLGDWSGDRGPVVLWTETGVRQRALAVILYPFLPGREGALEALRPRRWPHQPHLTLIVIAYTHFPFTIIALRRFTYIKSRRKKYIHTYLYMFYFQL